MQWLKGFFTKSSASDGVSVDGEKWNPRSGQMEDERAPLEGSFVDPKGYPEVIQRLLAVTKGTPTIYGERGYPGGMPTPHSARLLLEDFATGLAIPQANIQPGWKERLQSVAAGKQVDPSFWQP